MNFFKKFKDVFTKSVPDTSVAKQLDSADFAKLAMNTLLAAGAAGVAYLIDNLGHFDLGQYTALVVPVVLFGLQTAQKWLKDNTKSI